MHFTFSCAEAVTHHMTKGRKAEDARVPRVIANTACKAITDLSKVPISRWHTREPESKELSPKRHETHPMWRSHCKLLKDGLEPASAHLGGGMISRSSRSPGVGL